MLFSSGWYKESAAADVGRSQKAAEASTHVLADGIRGWPATQPLALGQATIRIWGLGYSLTFPSGDGRRRRHER